MSSLQNSTGLILSPDVHDGMPHQCNVANYVAQLARELSEMARHAELPLLSYFLDMAVAEAQSYELGAVEQDHATGCDPNEIALREPQPRT